MIYHSVTGVLFVIVYYNIYICLNLLHKYYIVFWLFCIFGYFNKYNSIYFVKNGGWHFTNLKTSKQIYYKFSNYLHHREFEHSNLGIKDINKMIKNKISIYNHEVDKSNSKFDGKIELSRLPNKFLPRFLLKNLNSYKKWLV